MDPAHEIAEKIEHLAHGEHGHGEKGHGAGIGRLAGITMAILGVMLALCAALVGGARTELIATMVDQSNTYQKYQAQRMKHRMMLSQLSTLHALSPTRRELKKFQEKLANVKPASGRADSEDVAETKVMIEMSTAALVKILEPHAEDQLRLVEMSKAYAEQTEAASKWAESYEEAVVAHTTAAEHFEWGQLAAEIGIVVASVALLLANRKAWYVSLVLGATCAGLLAWTFATTHMKTGHAEEEIKTTKAAYEKLRKDTSADAADKEILEAVLQRIHEENPGLDKTPPSHEGAPANHEKAPEHHEAAPEHHE